MKTISAKRLYNIRGPKLNHTESAIQHIVYENHPRYANKFSRPIETTLKYSVPIECIQYLIDDARARLARSLECITNGWDTWDDFDSLEVHDAWRAYINDLTTLYERIK